VSKTFDFQITTLISVFIAGSVFAKVWKRARRMGLNDSLMEFSPGSAFKSLSMVLGNGCQVAMIGREGRIRGLTRLACKYRSEHKSDILPWISDAFFQSRAAYLMNRNISDHKRGRIDRL